MDTTILQIPLSKSLKQSSQKVASEYGFSSLQDLLRVVLTKLSRRELVISIQDQTVKLSKASDRRYQKMSQDFKNGKNSKIFTSAETLLDDLRS